MRPEQPRLPPLRVRRQSPWSATPLGDAMHQRLHDVRHDSGRRRVERPDVDDGFNLRGLSASDLASLIAAVLAFLAIAALLIGGHR